MKPQVDGFEIVRAHDVRKLHSCGVCGQVGMHKEGMVRVTPERNEFGRKVQAHFAHVCCFVQYHNRSGRLAGLKKLASLARKERNAVRACDLAVHQWPRYLALCEEADAPEST